MGLLDHRRTWTFEVNSTPEECVQAFAKAMSGRAGMAKASWEVQRTGKGAVASYQGLGGVMGVVRSVSETSTAEQAGAKDSQVMFEVERGTNGTTTCGMWLSSYASRLGFTNDARFIRPYFGAVEKQLRALDPELRMVKG